MKKSELVIGGLYWVKVSGTITKVRVTSQNASGGGWRGINIATGRVVSGRNSMRLRAVVE